MQERVLTNKIARFQFNECELDKRFDFYRVKLPEEGSYPQKLVQVKRALAPISSVYFNRDTYYAMVKKNTKIHQNDALAIKPIPALALAEGHEIVLARLLLRAVPILLGEGNSIEADGLYYLVKKRKFKEFDCFVGLNVDFRWISSPFSCYVIVLNAQTFTPYQMHNKNKVSRYPRFDASLFKKLIKRSPTGEYVKRGIPKTKASVDMLDINGEELANFNNSKCGFLNQAQQDIERVYGENFTFDLEYSEPDYRIHHSKKVILEDYRQIAEYLQSQGLNLCNLSGDHHLNNEVLENVNKQVGLLTKLVEEPVSDMANLVLVKSPDYYKEFGLEDPYLTAKNIDPYCQAIIVDKLFVKGTINKEPLLASLKELVIKQEIKSQKFSLKKLPGHWGFAYVSQEKWGEEFTYHYLEVKDGSFQYIVMTPIEWLEHSEVHFDIENKDQYLAIDYDEDNYVLITEKEVMAIPDYREIFERLVELERGRGMAIPVSALQNYMFRIQDSKNKTEQSLLLELDEVLSKNANKAEICYEELYVIKNDKKKTIAYQGAKQKFYDYLMDEHDLHLKVSLKSKDGTLSSSLGFFYSPTTECYFVGSHEGAKSTINNFSKLRHVETDYAEIPLKFWTQFDAFYVRHKQGTVMPFAFKYLRECHEISVRRI